MTNEVLQPTPKAKIVKNEGFSAIWLVPAIALIFGAWLVYKAIAERGTFITVEFESASGIVEGKTQVKFKGLTAGTVTNVDIADDLQSVIVEIEMIPGASKALTEHTLFWYVTADVSFQGVSGLDTLLSGSYISIKPDFTGKGKSQKHFIALKEAPPLDQSIEGLHITLKSKTLGSLGKNSPVTFKQITVGYISSYAFNNVDNSVNINLFIEPEYEHLVKENSRFWNASGFNVTGSLTSGITLKTNSLASIIAGGVAFDSPAHEVSLPPAQNGQTFQLHDDYELAKMGHKIHLSLNWNSGLDIGAAIKYQGITLGHIESFSKIDPEARKVTAQARINPRATPYLTDQTQFYAVNPQVDLGGVTNMRTLMMGTHIGLRPSLEGKPANEFKVYNDKPPYHYSEPGLHLILNAKDVGSLTTSSGVFYKQLLVGSVQAIENLGPNDFIVHIHIIPKYKKYVSTDSRFWNSSGIRTTGGIQNFEVQAQSVQSILAGGIAFNNSKNAAKKSPENGTKYDLFDNQDFVNESIAFTLYSQSTLGLNVNTRIMYRGQKIGSIHEISHNKDGATISVGVLPEHNYILKESSQFWLVKPQVSLSGLADTEALFGGGYIDLTVGKGKTATSFILSNTPPAKQISADGLQLTLSTSDGNVVSAGSPISYRGISVGQVDNVALDANGKNVGINITIDDKYRHLISHYTRFFNASGITARGSLGDFVIKSESADALLRGGISFYTPENIDNDTKLEEGINYTLFDNIDEAQNAGLAITITFDNIDGLNSDMNIKYKSQDVGAIEHLIFDEDTHRATAVAYLSDQGKRFAVSDTKFWLSQPEIGLVGTKNLSSMLEGGFISLLPGISTEKSVEFSASNMAPVTKALHYGLNLKLTSPTLGSVRIGNPVLYRQIQVGKVIGVDLSPSADGVDIYINIAKRFMPLVRDGSKFWNTSGINVDMGLFSGMEVESESIETLLAGGIAFATPENESNTAVNQGQTFKLHDRVNGSWQDWRPKISIAE